MFNVTGKLIVSVAKRLASWAGAAITSDEFKLLVAACVSADFMPRSGSEKAAFVADQAGRMVPSLSRFKWLIQGLVWLAYAYARHAGMISRKPDPEPKSDPAAQGGDQSGEA